MRKFTILAVFLTAFLGANAQMESAKQIFESPNLKQETQRHKTVAILPFDTKISYRKPPKNFNAEANKEQELALSKSIQGSLYTFLLRRAKDYTVTFQDVEQTNILLKRAGMLDKLEDYTKDEIAKVLGVDAVLGGRFETEQTKSEAGAIVSTVLFGGMGSKTGTGTLSLNLNNGQDGVLLWRFFKSMNDSILSSTDVLIDRMMRKVSRNFPYHS